MFSISRLHAAGVKEVLVCCDLCVKNKFALCFKSWRSRKSVRKRFWPQSHKRNNEFDSHVQPFTSTRETSWRLYLFKAGLSQGGACKNSSPDQLRERKKERERGGREVLPESWGVLGMKPSVLSLTLLCHKRHSFCLLNHDDMSVAFWVIFLKFPFLVCIGYLDDLQHQSI